MEQIIAAEKALAAKLEAEEDAMRAREQREAALKVAEEAMMRA